MQGRVRWYRFQGQYNQRVQRDYQQHRQQGSADEWREGTHHNQSPSYHKHSHKIVNVGVVHRRSLSIVRDVLRIYHLLHSVGE